MMATSPLLMREELHTAFNQPEVTGTDEGNPLGAGQISINSDYRDTCIDSLVHDGVQRRLKANNYDTLGLLGNSLLESGNHGSHIVVSWPHILGAHAQVFASQLHTQFVIVEIIQAPRADTWM